MHATLERVRTRVAERFPADLERIRDHLRLPSVSATGERIRVPGLDGGRGPSDGDARLLAELAETFDPAEYLREAHAAHYRLPGDAAELLEALLYRPTLNVSGIAGGYVGPGGETIVLSRAVAMVDIRLMPDGDPESAAAAVRRHLDRHRFGHIQVRMLEADRWAKAPPSSRSELAFRASYPALGRRPLPYPLAPWCAPGAAAFLLAYANGTAEAPT